MHKLLFHPEVTSISSAAAHQRVGPSQTTHKRCRDADLRPAVDAHGGQTPVKERTHGNTGRGDVALLICDFKTTRVSE